MQDFDEQEMLFLRENILLSKVNGKIVIRVIKTDVGMVAGRVDSAESVGWVKGHVGRVWGSVGRVGSVDWLGNEESES